MFKIRNWIFEKYCYCEIKLNQENLFYYFKKG